MPPCECHHPEATHGSSQRGTVTFCITELDPGGAEKALVRVAAGLRKQGWQVSVVSLRNAGSLVSNLESFEIPVTALNCGGFLDIRAVFRLWRFLTEQQPQLLVCFLHQANIVGRIAGRLAGVRTVVSGIRVADRRKSVIWTERLTRRLTRKYVAASRHVADVHAKLCRIPPQKMVVIHNGVDIPESRSVGSNREDSQFRILFVGRLTKQKQPQHLVSAVAALPDELRSRTIVDFLGDGELKGELEDQIAAAGLASQIRLHGFQPDVAEWMAQADVLALPSAWEGLPNVVLESMACGLPVVATAVDGVPEMIDSGETGWLIPPGDVTALAEILSMVSADAALRRTVADRAFEAVRQRFHWEATIKGFDELLSDLLDDRDDVENHC